MPNHKGPPVASIIPTRKRGDHHYGIIKLNHNDISTTTAPPPLSIAPNSITTTTTTAIDNTVTTILCTTAIPIHISIPEFLNFVAPVDSFVSHYRVIRDTSPDSYVVLMKFRNPYSANDYYKQYNNRLFSSMEPEKCQVIYIESVEINSITMPPYTFPFLDSQQQSVTTAKATIAEREKEEEEEDLLPTCPVCLEPMDESNTGLLTILCQHTFHCHCLSKWGDGSCPVCRYSQKPEGHHHSTESHQQNNNTKSASGGGATSREQQATTERIIGDQNDENECTICQSTENLWVCLICGYVGCGRYVGAHAYQHYRETSHLYSLEIDTQRVWDYTGDGYVHRLIQNVVDGKLVELPNHNTDSPSGGGGYTSASQEKMEAISLEYSYLLTSQLDSQRIYYENQMDELTNELTKLTTQIKTLTQRVEEIKKENKKMQVENKAKQKLISDLEKGKERADKKLETWKEKCEATKHVWLEEKEMTNSLLENNGLLLKSMEDRERAIKELSDQVRDLMFFLEAREKVQGHAELEGGTLETHTKPQYHHTKSKRRGKR